MPCSCEGPGFCERHQRVKSFSEWQKCKESEEHCAELDREQEKALAEFEDYEGEGVGTEIHEILSSMGFEPGPNCSCHENQRKWDAAGIQWCVDNRNELVRALNKEAAARGVLAGQIAKYGGSRLIVDTAIESARSKGLPE